VLLVEDEDSVRTLISLILTNHGYTVLEARQGEDALVMSEMHDGPIHLLLTDVIMSGMSGRQLAQTLEPLRPDIHVIYMSGYTDSTVLRYGRRMKSPSCRNLSHPRHSWAVSTI